MAHGLHFERPLHGWTPNPEDDASDEGAPPPKVAAAAADDSESEAPLRVVYSYDAGILICGETYAHRQAIKGLRTMRFKFSRRLPDDCAWYVPRTRNFYVPRRKIEQIAEELREASGTPVDIDYTEVDPDALTPMEEREADRTERAEARADRLESRATSKKIESEAAYKGAKDIAKHIPFGQPILVGHHSEKRHRRDLEKIERGYRKSFEAQAESEHLERRAKASRRESDRRKDPNFAQRRIEELKTELRGLDVTLTGEMPEGWRGHDPRGPASGDYKTQLEVRRAEIVDQIGYWQRLVDESGVKVWGPEDFQPGDVLAHRNGFDIVVRVNKKTLTVDSPPHAWDLKEPYTNIKRPPVRGTDAWRKAVESYLNWVENRQPQPRGFPKRAKLARQWLAAQGGETQPTKPATRTWSTSDFDVGDALVDDKGQAAVVVGIKPRSLVLDTKNKDTGRLQRIRLRPALVREKLPRESDAWKNALRAYLEEIPVTEAHATRRNAVHQWLGLPLPDSVDLDQQTVDAATESLASPQDVHHIAEQLREGEIAALVRAHRRGRTGQVFGSILRQALFEHGLFDYESAALTPLGHQVAERLLFLRPGLGEDAPANTRPPDPPNTLRNLTGWPDSNVERKDVAAALRKLLRHRHPEVSFSVRTPNYSMAKYIDIHSKDGRRWTEAERSVLRSVFGPDLAISGNDASVSPWDRFHDGGSIITDEYVEDFKALLAGKKPSSKRPPKTPKKPRAQGTTKEATQAKSTAKPKRKPKGHPQHSPPKPTDMKQLSIWETPASTPKKNPGRPKSRTPKPRRSAPHQNPSKTFHLVAAAQALEKAQRMLALAQKSPRSCAAQLSAAMQAHSEAVLAHQNAAYVLDDGPSTPDVRKKMSEIRRIAATISRKAQVIVGAERQPKRRKAPQQNPSRPPKQTRSAAAKETIRKLRRL